MEITVPAKIENIPVITAFIDEQLEKAESSIKAQMQIDVALDELIANIAHYAYAPGEGDVTVGFSFDEESRMAEITLIDGGVPFDPLAKEDPDIEMSAEERSIGGLGIFVTKKIMDEISYAYENGQNVLRVRKRI